MFGCESATVVGGGNKVEETTRQLHEPLAHARHALGILEGSCRTLSKPWLAIHLPTLLESYSSYAIDGIHASLHELFLPATARHPHTKPTACALSYAKALAHGLETMRSGTVLDEQLLATIRAIQDERPLWYRTDCDQHLRSFVTGEMVRRPRRLDFSHAMGQILQGNRNTADPLLQLGELQYKMGALAPFSVGNGRTRRIIGLMGLCSSGLLTQGVLPLSAWFSCHTSDMLHLLQDIHCHGQESWLAWHRMMLKAVSDTATFTTDLVVSLSQAMAETQHVLPAHLAEHLFRLPTTTAMRYCSDAACSLVTARRRLETAARIGVLTKLVISGTTFYCNDRYWQLLKHFQHKCTYTTFH